MGGGGDFVHLCSFGFFSVFLDSFVLFAFYVFLRWGEASCCTNYTDLIIHKLLNVTEAIPTFTLISTN